MRFGVVGLTITASEYLRELGLAETGAIITASPATPDIACLNCLVRPSRYGGEADNVHVSGRSTMRSRDDPITAA
jgi:hypothetical protein